MSVITNPYVLSKQNSRRALVCPGCGNMFVAVRANQKCCSRPCTEQVWRQSQPERLITASQVRAAEQAEQPALAKPAPVPAPADNPPCRTCGKRLHDYDIARGECYQHPLARIRNARENVPSAAGGG